MREELGWNGGKAVDERFYVADRAHIVWKQVARFLTKRFRDAHEILDVQPALLSLQPGEVSGNRHGFATSAWVRPFASRSCLSMRRLYMTS